MICRYKVEIQGIVQGVGFRPFIYKLARQNKLFGYVSNTSKHVDIEIEGVPKYVHLFLKKIESCDLPLARITDIHKISLAPVNYHNFTIRKSATLSNRVALIPPDICVCAETGVDRVILSGGVFQNATLLTGLEKILKAKGFYVFSHTKIPTNDGGISLGQAAIAAAIRPLNGV